MLRPVSGVLTVLSIHSIIDIIEYHRYEYWEGDIFWRKNEFKIRKNNLLTPKNENVNNHISTPSDFSVNQMKTYQVNHTFFLLQRYINESIFCKKQNQNIPILA